MKKSDVKLGERLAGIILQLNSKEKVNISDLAKQFGFSKRTIQHDLNERFAIFGLKNDGKGNYWLDKHHQGLLTINDLKKFAELSGALEMLPDIDAIFLQDLFESKLKDSLLIKSPFEGDITKKREEFGIISKAITDRRTLKFKYKDKGYTVEPYKLLNIEGVWYLCSTHDGKLKTFRFLEIYHINSLSSNFILDLSINEIIESSDSIWMGNTQKQTVKLRVIPDFVDYFIERIDIPGQKEIIKEKDGSLTVVLDVYFTDEIQSIIKFWIPNIEILEPIELKEEINNQLLGYLNKTTT